MKKNNFRFRLKQTRLTRGLTQSSIENMTGIHYTIISMYESGHRLPSFESLRKLCQALNVSADYLMNLSTYHLNDSSYDNLTRDHQDIVDGLVNILQQRQSKPFDDKARLAK